MIRREFMKKVFGIGIFPILPKQKDKSLSSTWVYRNLSDPHGTRSYWHPVFKASGYYGESPRVGREIGRGWVKFCDGMLSTEEWCYFIRKYHAVRKVIESSEVVADDELPAMDVSELLHTLYKVAYYLRNNGISEDLIQSAVKPPKYL